MQAGEIVDRMYVLNVYMFGFYVLQMIETNSKRCACEGKKTHVKCYCYYILIGWNRFRYNILWCAFQMGITCVLGFYAADIIATIFTTVIFMDSWIRATE